MASITRTPARHDRLFEHGIIAGLIGGTTVELFLFATHVASWPGTYQWVASGLVGKAAFASVSYVWLGLLLHALVSLAWGLTYALLARLLPLAIRRPVPAGLAYGLVVFVAMQLVTMAIRIWALPSLPALLLGLLAHTVFFGLPLALYASRAMRGWEHA